MVELCLSYEKVMGVMEKTNYGNYGSHDPRISGNDDRHFWCFQWVHYWKRAFPVGALLKKRHTWINRSLAIAISKRRKIDSAHNVIQKYKEKVQQSKRHAATGHIWTHKFGKRTTHVEWSTRGERQKSQMTNDRNRQPNDNMSFFEYQKARTLIDIFIVFVMVPYDFQVL